MHSLYTNARRSCSPGTMEEEADDEDYENSTPPYKDLPPKPGWVAPPRPPRTGKNPPLPCKPLKTTALDLPAVTCTSGQSGVPLPPPIQPPPIGVPLPPPTQPPPIGVPLPPPTQPPPIETPGPWLRRKPQVEGLPGYLCLLAAASLLLSCVCTVVTLVKYREVVEELRVLTSQQAAWRANVTGMAGLAGLRRDIDLVRADTNQSLLELRGLVECPKVTCPVGWLPFEGKCYYFSPSTKSWDGARRFCQENYAHLVIINSFAEHNFLAKAHGSPRVYWLGLNDKDQEGDWRWLDGSPVTLSFWDPQEPNNAYEEDCASMNQGGTWNDLSCAKTTYWICERKCSC